MKCPCGNSLELQQYTQNHPDGLGPKLLYACPDEKCKICAKEVVRKHLPGGEKTLEQLRADYFKHALEIPMIETE